MSSFISHLSATAEFWLITFLCFGVQAVWAVRAIVRHWNGTAPRQVRIGNAGVLRVVILELVCLSAALWIGNIRGWSLGTLGLQLSWMGTAAGVGLFAAVLAGATLLGVVLKVFRLEVAFSSILPGTSLPFVLLLAAVNPLYGEALQFGYLLHALQDFGMWPAVLASAFFTSFLHAYLTLQSVTLVFLTRVAVGLAYWHWRQLWPLIVAHALLDLVALLRPWPNGAYSGREPLDLE
jgi:hypothetical protein